MTLNNVVNNIYDLSVNGHFNGEHFTKKQFSDAVKHWMCSSNEFILEAELPDGYFYISIFKYDNKSDCYDYYIPDTREESDKLLEKLMNRYNS